MSAGETITVIRARGRRLAKRVRADGGIDAYDSARTYDLFTVGIADLAVLGRLLGVLLARPDCAVVRGAIIDPARTRRMRRLVHVDRKTGEYPTLEERSRSWLALDVDSTERPAGVAADDLPGCWAAAVDRLPAAFRDAACIVQASGSHGLKPGLRLRLWYWLDRPLSGLEAKRWLRGFPVDPSVFRPAQVIYTAAPVFDRPADDPLPARMTLIERPRGIVHAPPASALAPPPRPPAPLPAAGTASANRYVAAALRNAAARVVRAGIGSRHDTILSEARNLARFVAAGLLAEGEVLATLAGAGEHAGKPREECQAIVAWAFAHPSVASLPAGARA
jgi:hypothetical protein